MESINIYEVNLRQYTPDGNFTAFTRHLPRLKAMGVSVLWLMPIYPVSRYVKKGRLGSPYGVADYTNINPDLGTLQEFAQLVSEIHQLEMKVLLDWVPNHTGWGHHWIQEHPDWYTLDPTTGNISFPKDKGELTDWYDVAELNYQNAEMREAMIRAMLFWVEEYQVDGFRIDTAHNQSLEFWKAASDRLRKANPQLILLGETEDERYRNNGSFDITYSWTLHHLLNRIAQGRNTAAAVKTWLAQTQDRFTKGDNLQFITNHDENTWKGTVEERMGIAGETMLVLTFTLDGISLIYGGQEAGHCGGLTKRLKFFEKDCIDWNKFCGAPLLKKLLTLKHQQPALWNGVAGGSLRSLIRIIRISYLFFTGKRKIRW